MMLKSSSIDNSLLATGNVKFQDESYLITGDLLSATRDEDENLIANATNANYQDFGAGLRWCKWLYRIYFKNIYKCSS